MSRFRPPLVRGPVTVLGTRFITPQMVRVSFDTGALVNFAATYPAHALKIFVPCAGQPEPIGRAYTVRRFSPESCRLDVDFLLHGHGLAATWALTARAGDVIEIAGPRAGFDRKPDAAWQLMVGDATAIPAIMCMLESLPADLPAFAFIAVRDAAEEQAVQSAASVRIQWIHLGDDIKTAGERLEAAVRAAVLPDGPGQIFIAAEASAVKRVRALFPRAADAGYEQRVAAMHATGYWKQGATDYHDHQ